MGGLGSSQGTPFQWSIFLLHTSSTLFFTISLAFVNLSSNSMFKVLILHCLNFEELTLIICNTRGYPSGCVMREGIKLLSADSFQCHLFGMSQVLTTTPSMCMSGFVRMSSSLRLLAYSSFFFFPLVKNLTDSRFVFGRSLVKN